MARKRDPKEDPPTASSTDEEGEGSSDEEEGEEVDEEVQKGDSSSEEEEDDADDGEDGPPLRSSKNPGANKSESGSAVTTAVEAPTTVPMRQASDGSDAETESDSETERRAKPVAVKSVEQNRDSKKIKASESLASPAKSTAKRPSKTEHSSKDAKRMKKDPEGKSGARAAGVDEKKAGDDAKKPYFQRLWSEDDEIAVLKGMIDYKSDTGVSPYDDMNGFYDYAKKSISFDVSKIQFMDKIRSLKKKYMNNLGKGKNGEDPSFAKAHDQKAFELSKSVWGTDGSVLESAVKINGKSKKNQKGKMITAEQLRQELFSSPNGKKEEDNRKMETDGREITSAAMNRNDGFEMIPIDRIVKAIGTDEFTVKQGLSMIAAEDKKKLEKMWKALRVNEMDFLVQKSQFVSEAARMIAEAFRSSH